MNAIILQGRWDSRIPNQCGNDREFQDHDALPETPKSSCPDGRPHFWKLTLEHGTQCIFCGKIERLP